MNAVREKKVESLAVVLLLTFLVFCLTAAVAHLMLHYDTGDFPTHLDRAITYSVESYSLLDIFYRIAWKIYPEGISAVFVVGLVGALGFFFSILFVEELMPAWERTGAGLTAFIAYLAGPVHIAAWNSSHTIGVQSGAIWHNPPYLGMKMLIPLGLLFFLRRERGHGTELINTLGLLIACTLGTAVKPNFILCFGTMLFLEAMFLTCREKREGIRRLVETLLTLLPSGAILAVQYGIKYEGENAESGFAVAPFLILKHYAEHPILAVLQSLAFVLFVFCVMRREIWKEPVYRFVLGMTGIGYAESFLLIETGPRMYDANWTWGADMCVFALLLVSIPLFLDFFRGKIRDRDTRSLVFCAIGGGLLLWQFLSGVSYLFLVFQRKTMWL